MGVVVLVSKLAVPLQPEPGLGSKLREVEKAFKIG